MFDFTGVAMSLLHGMHHHAQVGAYCSVPAVTGIIKDEHGLIAFIQTLLLASLCLPLFAMIVHEFGSVLLALDTRIFPLIAIREWRCKTLEETCSSCGDRATDSALCI